MFVAVVLGGKVLLRLKQDGTTMAQAGNGVATG